ncbi:HAMP domain-containing sensor histidine kinase [Rhizobium sp. S152]|uniref:sensor histidine kinase n=1 Tax=Rhizobium sp. S152 TaxID=3055038 RepID=UPI0025A9D9C0|nr:HAMP domain-containing sensor histidine kinase [Rhizobium sp. S152]MDM9624959.1 HAMP domain-containing sensor histidine kinase [Rhizobium sp. S152]
MSWNPFGQRSLKSQLVIRFGIVLGLLMIVLNVGFLGFLYVVLPEKIDADEAVKPVITAALKEDSGELVVDRSGALAELTETTPSFWFAAVDASGRRVSFGQVPPQYAGLLSILNDIHLVDIRGENGSSITAKFADLVTAAGPVKVLYGGKPTPGTYISNVMMGLSVVYVPFTLIPVVLVFLALPLLVGRGLSGTTKTIGRMASIDANSLGTRLAKDDVVLELHPLVNAINATLERIDEDVRLRRRFFANAAHELRTPIAILQTRLEGMAPGPERSRLLKDTGRLAETAEQLLDMERFGNIQSWADVDLVDLCKTVVADCAPIAIAAGYELGFYTPVLKMIVRGDRDSLQRAVTNLVRNAIEHAGGAGDIRVELSEGGVIDVGDDGPGIPFGEREKVFEPFYRSTPRQTGAGLGLSIVHQIAQSHNGSVSIVPQVCGARLRLKLGR